jgi:hypothetical protein
MMDLYEKWSNSITKKLSELTDEQVDNEEKHFNEEEVIYEDKTNTAPDSSSVLEKFKYHNIVDSSNTTDDNTVGKSIYYGIDTATDNWWNVKSSYATYSDNSSSIGNSMTWLEKYGNLHGYPKSEDASAKDDRANMYPNDVSDKNNKIYQPDIKQIADDKAKYFETEIKKYKQKYYTVAEEMDALIKENSKMKAKTKQLEEKLKLLEENPQMYKTLKEIDPYDEENWGEK